jgi:hypothetical protein
MHNAAKRNTIGWRRCTSSPDDEIFRQRFVCATRVTFNENRRATNPQREING